MKMRPEKRDNINKRVKLIKRDQLGNILRALVDDIQTPVSDSEQVAYFITSMCKNMSTNRFAHYTHKGYPYLEGAFMKWADYPLVKNADGKISAKLSLEEITDEALKQLVRLIAYSDYRTSIIPTAKKLLPKYDYTANIPIWAFIHKLHNGVMYEDWSLDEEDMPELVFTRAIMEGIRKFRDANLMDSISGELAENRKIVINLWTKSPNAGNINVNSFEIDSRDDMMLNEDVSPLTAKTLLQVGYSHPNIVNEYSIRNYVDLDAAADFLEGAVSTPSIDNILDGIVGKMPEKDILAGIVKTPLDNIIDDTVLAY